MFAIGVGHKINRDELLSIASEPPQQFTFEVEDYGMLDALKNILAWEVCQGTSPLFDAKFRSYRHKRRQFAQQLSRNLSAVRFIAAKYIAFLPSPVCFRQK